MASVKRFVPWGATINGASIPIMKDSLQISSQLNVELLAAAGGQVATFGATVTNTPGISFSTKAIDAIETAEAITSVVISMRSYSDDGGMGSTYKSISVSRGLIVPQNISGSAGGSASKSITIIPTSSDGDSDPIVIGSTSVTLPSLAEAFTIGDVSFGTSVEEVSGIEVNYGYQIESNAGISGKPFPTYACVISQNASLAATTNDIGEATQTRINTGQKLSSSISASFRKLQEGNVPTTGYSVSLPSAIVSCESMGSGSPGSAAISAVAIASNSGGDLLSFSGG